MNKNACGAWSDPVEPASSDGRSGHRWSIVAVVAACLQSGCASVLTTVEKPDEPAGEGVVYWLPKKSIGITITIGKDSEPTQVDAAPTAAYPDYSQRFVLQPLRNPVGKRQLDVQVDERGLLKTVNSKALATPVDALKGLAESLAAVTARGFAVPPADCEKGVFKKLVEPGPQPVRADLCGYDITVEPAYLPEVNPPGHRLDTPRLRFRSRESGIFYRQELPYLVTVQRAAKPKEVRHFIVFSPTGAPVKYLPVPRALFADNDVGLTFNDGVLTRVDQTKAGETFAVLKLPADLIGAYFAAIGKIFGDREKAAESQLAVLEAKNQLLIEQMKNENCRAAISAGLKAEEIKAACGVK